MISLTGVSKIYGKKYVLKDINLSFASGQTHVLLGSSGSGKSTILRMIMGLLIPDSGEVLVQGIRVGPDTQKHVPTRAGYVIQDGGLFPHFTCAENVTLVAKTRGWSKNKIAARLHEVATIMGFDPTLFDRYPKQLSGGQKQRVALMRSLMLDPPILLMDEPMGALDPIARASLQKELKHIFNSLKKTVILVTHDVNEAAYFGHSVTLIDDGKIVQQGPYQEFWTNPASPFVTQFMNAQVSDVIKPEGVNK
jgi:osmoprotectant transport system ATP-binding protein